MHASSLHIETELPKIKDIEREKKTKLTDDEFRESKNKVELDLKQEFLEGNIQDRRERKKFADKIFILLICYLFITLTIVIFSGFGNMDNKYSFKFNISDTVLVTLLATTCADVIGIFLFVVRYLFKANSTAIKVAEIK